jgi:hypothetical protein
MVNDSGGECLKYTLSDDCTESLITGVHTGDNFGICPGRAPSAGRAPLNIPRALNIILFGVNWIKGHCICRGRNFSSLQLDKDALMDALRCCNFTALIFFILGTH